ncbi:hypothetical protein AABB87_02970 [Roseateles sp. PN1]
MIYVFLAIIFAVLAIFAMNNYSRLIDSIFLGLSNLNNKLNKGKA